MLQMYNRINLLERMKACKFNLDHTDKFTMNQLSEACDRLFNRSIVLRPEDERNQRLQEELILNPDFTKMYQAIIAHKISGYDLQQWLETADESGDTITDYAIGQFLQAAELEELNSIARYEYLKYYSHMQLEPEKLQILIRNLKYLTSEPYKCRISELAESQRMLLLDAYFERYVSVTKESALSTMALLSENPEIQKLLKMLSDRDVDCYLDYERLTNLKWLQKESILKIDIIWERLDQDSEWIGLFMERWLENGSMEYDLDWLVKKGEFMTEQKDVVFGSQVGYTNAIYGGRLDVPYEKIKEYQKEVLYYAIAHKKKHFMKLVSENFGVFSDLEYNAMLFSKDFYKRCNLNTLSLTDLKDCHRILGKKINIALLDEGTYTFAELKALWYADPVYIKFYNSLNIKRVDERLIVLRQLLKNNILPKMLEDQSIEALAKMLSQKPLSMWHAEYFSHIDDVFMADTLQFLLSYEKLERFLCDMNSKEEVLYAIRNADMLKDYESWAKARKDILLIDRDFVKLREYLQLTDAFIEENMEHIQKFLMAEGAEMSRIYYEYTPQKEAFRRILLAELMGKFQQVKYFEDDLKKEIEYSINHSQKEVWKENLKICTKEMEIIETDDFYSTLKIGTLPYETCLAYKNGMHRDCVLAGYDSNKKMLLAKKGGFVVGRAVIRLTKGSCLSPGDRGIAEDKLEFADLLSVEERKPRECAKQENLVLFLEVPYFAHVTEEEQDALRKQFVALVTKKASSLNAVPVLANAYHHAFINEQYVRIGYYLYISRSKSGVQYLDSLSGSAETSTEGSYRKNILWVLKNSIR